jgi:uncharacterized surface protein with fasciclin (FAS1) repeats
MENSMVSFIQRYAQGAIAAGLIGAGAFISAPAIANEAMPETTVQQPEQHAQAMTIVDIAAGDDSFSTLVQAVQAAGLVETLSGEGPFTVFAPTNAAFEQLPDGALEFLLQPENQEILQQVLTYHVVAGSVTSDQISTGKVEAIGGGLAVLVGNGSVIVNNASVTTADIEASNGVIHVVNRVLLSDTLQSALAAELGVDDIY